MGALKKEWVLQEKTEGGRGEDKLTTSLIEERGDMGAAGLSRKMKVRIGGKGERALAVEGEMDYV